MMTPSITPVQANCPSGNCTWPSTPTLAVCGDCAPTSPLHSNCSQGACYYTLPSGTLFELTDFATAGTLGTGFQVQWSSSGGKHWNSGSPTRLYIANWEQIGAPFGSTPSAYASDAYSATECALCLCVNTYNITMTSNTQFQSLVSSLDHIDYDWYNAGHTGNDYYSFMPPNTTSSSSVPYSVSFFATEALSGGLLTLLNGTVQLNDRGYLASSDAIDAIWNGDGSTTWIKNLALSMSNVVRTTASDSSSSRESYNGIAYVQGIRIRWWWLWLSGAAVVATMVLLVVVMIRTTRSEVCAWKGSPLVFLFCDVDEKIKREGGAGGWFERADGMDEVGKRRVALRRSEKGGWRFEEVY